MRMRDVLIDGKIVKREWKNPAPMICPACHTYLPEAVNECLVCKDLKAGAERKMEREAVPKQCSICGQFLTHGRCSSCGV